MREKNNDEITKNTWLSIISSKIIKSNETQQNAIFFLLASLLFQMLFFVILAREGDIEED
jgi:hypothetical protein